MRNFSQRSTFASDPDARLDSGRCGRQLPQRAFPDAGLVTLMQSWRVKPADRSELPRLVIMRLRAARIGGSGRLGTGPSTDPDFDVDVRIYPFDEDLAERIRAAVPDVRVRVIPGRPGYWVRA